MDVLKIIEDLKERLWEKYGNVLKNELSQDDIHMTYYAGDILEKNGYQYKVFDGETYYTENAMQAAFIAGLRVGRKDIDEVANVVNERLANAIAYLEREMYERS
jgi:hypothetical protein